MLIDNEENLNTEKDELIWNKLITINTEWDNKKISTHLVKYYRSDEGKEYYLFEYLLADNNGRNLCNYNEKHYRELRKILKPKNDAPLYEKIFDKDEYRLATMGYFVNTK